MQDCMDGVNEQNCEKLGFKKCAKGEGRCLSEFACPKNILLMVYEISEEKDDSYRHKPSFHMALKRRYLGRISDENIDDHMSDMPRHHSFDYARFQLPPSSVNFHTIWYSSVLEDGHGLILVPISLHLPANAFCLCTVHSFLIDSTMSKRCSAIN